MLPSAHIRRAVEARWNSLTKPPGSLGRLESLIADLAVIQGTADPKLDRKSLYLFCADHGSTVDGTSAWPSEVTAQMVRNFLRGGAAISVLGAALDIELTVVDCGVLGEATPGTINRSLGQGTRNFLREPAMTRDEAERALANGTALAQDCTADIVGVGEMGIGNTASASALVSAFLNIPACESVGEGAGMTPEGLQRKRALVASALELHQASFGDPIDTLAAVGGFEIATMAGFLLGCAARRRAVVVDGFITSAAVLAARAVSPDVTECLLYAHCSAEHAHARVLERLGALPILNLGMRLGEGSGAALAIGLLSQAHDLYMKMATFEQAAVAESNR